MKKFIVLLMIILGTSVMAYGNHSYDYRYDRGYDDGCRDAHRYEKHHVRKKACYVKVVRSKPIYREVVTYRECRTSRHHYNTHNHDGALIGGLIGGIIGHNMDTRHRAPSTIGGAVVGAIIGSKLSHLDGTPPLCKHVETQLVGYKNIAYWHGEKIVRISDEPLRRIRIGRKYRCHH